MQMRYIVETLCAHFMTQMQYENVMRHGTAVRLPVYFIFILPAADTVHSHLKEDLVCGRSLMETTSTSASVKTR